MPTSPAAAEPTSTNSSPRSSALFPNPWRLYHNSWSPPQQRLIEQIRQQHPDKISDRQIEFRLVRAPCLSLRHHFEFLRFKDDADLYHYLHFDMPLGMRNLPLVFTIHDLYPLTVPEYCSAPQRAYFYRLTRRNARRAAAIITISENTRKDILQWLDVPQDKITLIPQGHSNAFGPLGDPALLNAIKEKYRLPRSFILYCGNHKPHKNLHRLLQAFARLDKHWRDQFSLVLTGPVTSDTQTLRRRAADLAITDKVIFTGFTLEEDLPILYNLADLLVQASLYEGFGLPPLEAMACGTAVACSNRTAISEVVGDVGRLFDPYAIDSIAQAITAALENDLDNPRARQACLDQAQKFSWKKTAQKTHRLYQTLAP